MSEAGREVGRRLREAREKSDMSPADVAKAIGCKPALITQVEAGRSSVSISGLNKLAKLYNTPYSWLSGGTRD